MVLSSSGTKDHRPPITLSPYQLRNWFLENKGKEISSKEKPLDSDKHCKQRIDWVIDHYGQLTNPYTPVAYLDEKWFYRVNRRRSLKVLPTGLNEEKGMGEIKRPKMLSRRYPIKTMFLGVVCRPIPHRNFNGKIHLEHVAKNKFVTTRTAHTYFSFDAVINSEIKSGAWRDLVAANDEFIGDVRVIISTAYELDECITECLEFYYSTKIGNNGNTKDVQLEDNCLFKNEKIRINDDKNVPPRYVKMSDIKLRVRKEIGDEIQVDCSCDSDYMLRAMDRVGAAIRSAYHWVSMEDKCYLVMDNAGGHGTNTAIEQYSNNLLQNFNIEIIWQIPRSPYTNVLDLGIWMSLQARVEREHYLKRCTAEALVHSVQTIWNSSDLDAVMTKVFNKLRVVFCNILNGNGGNDLVEENRGEKNRSIKLEKVMRDLEKANTNNDVITLHDYDGFSEEDEGFAQIQLI